MKKGKQIWFIRMNIWHLFLLASILIVLSGCGIAKDTIDGMTGEELKEDVDKDSDAIIVEIVVESDGDSVIDLEVEIDARKYPQSVYYDSVNVPYRAEFAVPKDVFIPLTSSRVKARATDNATWVSCTILYDGEVVATHRSQGDDAEAVCEKTFQLGPG